ncbi:exo-alpha-sialidase [Paenibacillus thalictri]|uniref:Exo-alpha-sialidase n=1 Tax=Paenibacillus thalictri TaxID=2527873 RepID=A0A4Q9DG51_9BACL|nr:sialidase family protein [Paenibacillus thalictri]TBL70538.1 exo-alpha-sialidase [Paenibacillus thalictri]
MDTMRLIYWGKAPNLVCCEAILREMPNGEWVTFIQTGGFTEPHIDNDVYLSRSTDRGETWGPLVRLFDIPGKATYQTEAMVLGDEVTLFVTVHNGKFLDWEQWMCVSRDSGYTWSELVPLPVPHLFERTFIRTLYHKRNGELVLPYQHYHVAEEELARLRAEDLPIMRTSSYRSDNGVLISRDNGKTWDAHGGISIDLPNWNWAENNVVELSDGRMVMLIRADRTSMLYRSDSADGGRTWSEAYPSGIVNAGTKLRLFRLKDDRIALLHNPAPWRAEHGLASRNPLSLWISDDDMKTWSVQRDLVTFPGGLSYPDGFVDEDKGVIHFTFDYNKHDTIYVGARIDG